MLLESLGLRERKGLDLIVCPSCGRAEVDVIGVAAAAQAALEERKIPLQVAVMGCVVNGPGEAKEADLGIAGGRGKGHLFVRGQGGARRARVGDGRGARGRSRGRSCATASKPARPRPIPTPKPSWPPPARNSSQIQGLDANRTAEKIQRIEQIERTAN